MQVHSSKYYHPCVYNSYLYLLSQTLLLNSQTVYIFHSLFPIDCLMNFKLHGSKTPGSWPIISHGLHHAYMHLATLPFSHIGWYNILCPTWKVCYCLSHKNQSHYRNFTFNHISSDHPPGSSSYSKEKSKVLTTKYGALTDLSTWPLLSLPPKQGLLPSIPSALQHSSPFSHASFRALLKQYYPR